MEVVEEGDGFLKLSWDVPDDGGSPIVKYVVHYGDGRSDEISPADNYMISDLDNGKTYKIGVRARNAVGLGEWSDLVEGTPRPPAIEPGRVVGVEVVEEGDGFLKLSWDVPDDGGSPIVKYVVHYGDGRSDEISPADNYMISDLDNGKTYKIGVRARNAVGLGEWSDLVEGTPRPPAAPPVKRPAPPAKKSTVPSKVSGLRVVEEGDGFLRLSWRTPNSGGSRITGYVIKYGSSQRKISVTNSFTITGLENSTKYMVYVRARNGIGLGPWSNSITATPKSPAKVPGKVEGVKITEEGDGFLKLSWRIPNSGTSRITGYVIKYGSSQREISSANSFSLKGLDNGTKYRVYVRARSAVGYGPWSDPKEGTPKSPPGVPGKVEGLQVIKEGDGFLKLSWKTPSSGASQITGYVVKYGVSQREISPANRFSIMDLKNNKKYTVHVRARNSAGYGPWSDPKEGTPQPPPEVPGKVDGVRITEEGDSVLKLSWMTPSSGASQITGYVVKYGVSQREISPANSFTIRGLENNTKYTIYVRARNSAGYGQWSDSVIGRPQLAHGVPGKVEGLRIIEEGDSLLKLSWRTPSSGASQITGYLVKYNSSYGSSQHEISSVNSFSITGLNNNTKYTVYVRARNSVGYGPWSDHETGTPIGPARVPSKVEDLKIIEEGDSFIVLSWSTPQDGGSPITGYVIDAGVGYSIKTPPVNSHTIRNLNADLSYTIRVRAQNAVGNSSWSKSVTGTPGRAVE